MLYILWSVEKRLVVILKLFKVYQKHNHNINNIYIREVDRSVLFSNEKDGGNSKNARQVENNAKKCILSGTLDFIAIVVTRFRVFYCKSQIKMRLLRDM